MDKKIIENQFERYNDLSNKIVDLLDNEENLSMATAILAVLHVGFALAFETHTNLEEAIDSIEKTLEFEKENYIELKGKK